ncbi:MAG: hypothetical protein ACYCS8_18700 [Acidithiobacillus sp.]
MSANTITYDEFIKNAVDAFLGWHLPHNFNPDGGIVFDPIYNKGTPYENRHDPVGTNLFDADQARDMFEACIPERVFVEATTENAALKARVAELEGALKELVVLKHLSEEGSPEEQVLYRSRKPLAWAVARRLLGGK